VPPAHRPPLRLVLIEESDAYAAVVERLLGMAAA
jgi:hypothetical protein